MVQAGDGWLPFLVAGVAHAHLIPDRAVLRIGLDGAVVHADGVCVIVHCVVEPGQSHHRRQVIRVGLQRVLIGLAGTVAQAFLFGGGAARVRGRIFIHLPHGHQR